MYRIKEYFCRHKNTLLNIAPNVLYLRCVDCNKRTSFFVINECAELNLAIADAGNCLIRKSERPHQTHQELLKVNA